MTARISQSQLESYLWGAAVLLRGTIDAGDYKQFIFPLLFYKRVCDVYDEETALALAESEGDEDYAQFPEHHRFQIPPEAHWRAVRQVARDVGGALQAALRSIEIANPDKLLGIFGDAQWTNKDRLPDALLRDLIEHLSTLELTLANLPEDELGQGYEYLIKQFADDSGHTAAEFYTNRTVVHLMTALLQPQPGESVYDPTCGSGGMLLSCVAHLRDQGQEWRNVRLYGQERNLMTSSIARMNCFLHGIEDFRIERGDTLAEPKFVAGDRLQQFDVVLANPPYSIKQWDRAAFASDPWGRNLYGTPPQGRADYAFWQHILASLAPGSGRCAILFPHGVLFRQEEAEMRRKLIEADLIEAIIGLGPNLFYNSPMEACVVICRQHKPAARRGRILLLNAVGEVTRERAQSYLTAEHQARIVAAYERYADEPGFCRVVTLEQARAQGGNLSIPLYVSANGGANMAPVDGRAALAEALDDWLASRVALAEALQAVLPDLPLPALDLQVGDLEACGLFGRTGWQRVRFGDIADSINERVEPSDEAEAIYVGLEHLDSQDLHIHRWGKGSDVIGTKLRFHKGDIIFGRRRAYQRKLAVTEFDGICSAHAMVLRARPEAVLPEFLPFLMMSDVFMNRAMEISVGSLSPTINWSTLRKEEFDLPPLEQQRRISAVLWAVEEAGELWIRASAQIHDLAQSIADRAFASHLQMRHISAAKACDLITVGIVVRPASYYTEEGSGIPALRSLNVFPGRYDLSDLVYLTPEGHEKHLKSELKEGQVVIVRTGRPGDAAAVTKDVAGMNLIDLILVQPKPILLPEYLVEYVNSGVGRQQVLSGSSGTAQQHYNVSQFERMQIPVPTIDEQLAVVRDTAAVRECWQMSVGAQDRIRSIRNTILSMSVPNKLAASQG